MSRFACIVALFALVVAPALRVPASAAVTSAGAARLDAARMFDPVSESLLAALFAPPKDLSPVAVALFDAPDPAATALPSPQPSTPAGALAVIPSVSLHAYAPDEPLAAPPARSVAPVAAVVLRPPHVDLTAPQALPQIAQPARVHFGSYTAYQPAVQALSGNVRIPVRVGGVHFSGVVSGMQAQTQRADPVRAMQLCGTTDEAAPCPYLHDESTQNIAAGTAFDVRAGNTKLNVEISGSVGRVNGRDALYQYTPLEPDLHFDTRAGSPGDPTLLAYPGLTQIVRHGIDARIAVPVSPAISVGLQYNRSHYQGDYTTLLAPGLDARKDTYLGNVTYRLPNTSSFVTLSARQYHYQDTFAPNFNLTETRADLSFTVKF